MNHEPTVTQYLTKNELYDEFGRHPRTITKDITKAIATGDQELLLLAQLHTKNGKIIEATDVTSNTWKELSNEGENPAWYFSPQFVEIVRSRNAKHRSPRRTQPRPTEEPSREKVQGSTNANSPQHESSKGEGPELPSDPSLRAIVLEHLQFQSYQHINENKELMDRILKLVETNQQLQSQTNALFNQFQVALQEGTISNSPTPVANVAPQPTKTTEPKKAPENTVIVVEETEKNEETSSPVKAETKKAKGKAKAKPEKVVVRSSAKASTKKKNRTKKKAPSKKKASPAKAPRKKSGFLGRLFGNN
jgi:hypothetical protein